MAVWRRSSSTPPGASQRRAAPSLREADMSDASTDFAAITSLSRGVLFEVFDEHDPIRRTEAIERTFSSDVRFVDHSGARHGRDAVAAAVEQLQALLAGFRFSHTTAPQVLDGAARLSWRFGPPSDPAQITGSDIIFVREGRVSVLLVFLDLEAASANG
jgi:hypothetical protein